MEAFHLAISLIDRPIPMKKRTNDPNEHPAWVFASLNFDAIDL
jgi:hypothetical protein